MDMNHDDPAPSQKSPADYPHGRVLFGFTCAPLVISGPLGALVFLAVLFDSREADFMEGFGLAYLLGTLVCFVGLLLFLIPAFFAALTYQLYKPHRSVAGVIATGITGGCFAALWPPLLDVMHKAQEPMSFAPLVFFCGTLASVVISQIVLPEKI